MVCIYLYLFFLRITQDTAGLIGFTILVFFSFLALWGGFAQLLVPPNVLFTHTLFLRNPEFGNYDLPDYDSSNIFDHPPNSDFWFGTDWAGRDVFSRVIFGTSFTFLIAIVGSLIGLFFVVFFGFTSAYFGGWYDNVVMRVSDALLTFPPFIFLVLLATVSVPLRVAIPGGYFLAVYTGMAFVTWPLGARIIRAEVKQILTQEYIQAAKHLGSSDFRILYSHVFPKILPTLLIIFSYSFTDIIIGTTILGYIGFSAESTLTWGSDINKAVIFSPNLYFFWWEWLFPTMALFLLVFGLTLFSDSVRDNLDPYLRGGIESVPYEKRLEMDL